MSVLWHWMYGDQLIPVPDIVEKALTALLILLAIIGIVHGIWEFRTSELPHQIIDGSVIYKGKRRKFQVAISWYTEHTEEFIIYLCYEQILHQFSYHEKLELQSLEYHYRFSADQRPDSGSLNMQAIESTCDFMRNKTE